MTYTGRTTKTGNSKAFRFESALFVAHPEFAAGDVEGDVIAPGRLLVRTRVDGEEDDDPVLDAFLGFLAKQMQDHPERIVPFSVADVEGVEELLAGVEYDPGERIDPAFELP